MEVIVWNDYICPWAYAARPRTAWLRDQRATIGLRAYELHPNLPPEGRPIRPGGRLDKVLDHIGAECERQGQPFVKPDRSPNSRRCLELFEIVNAAHPNDIAGLDDDLAEAHWVKGLAIDDPAVLEAVLRDRLGKPAADDVISRHADGEGSRLLDESKALAHDVGVTATPSWRIGELTITGLHPPEQFERWAGRLLTRER